MKTTPKQESIEILLIARVYIYKLLQRFFGNNPDLESIGILTSDHTRDCFSLLLTSENETLQQGLDKLEQVSCDFSADKEGFLAINSSEYTRLFVGPNKLQAPPWESVYVSEQRVLFQESTLQVRQCYLKYNFIPLHFRAEADDHIALELDFMYNLGDRAKVAFMEGRLDEAAEILRDQKSFLEKHLLVWAPGYATGLELASSSSLYQGLACLLKGFLAAEPNLIQEILVCIKNND